MIARWLLPTFLICWTAVAAGQISGQFYLEKSTFAPGEPIFLYFQIINDGATAQDVVSADPYSFCSGYQINVSSDRSPRSLCAPSGGGAGSCLSSLTSLRAGKKHVERLLLNFDHTVDIPGNYTVEAVRYLSDAHRGGDHFRGVNNTLEVRTTLYFRVDQNATMDLKGFQPWVEQLRSIDPVKRREAARTLASLAPPSLEETLLTFADTPDFRQFAPLAFQRLHTARSMAAMAELLKTQPGTFEHMKSAEYLGESGDSQWFPLLRELAQKNARISNYVDAAARLGGDKMLPTLISLAGSPDKEFTRINAVTAMGSTGSRAAVPILLNFLKSPDKNIADSARYALRLLTHRTASDDQNESPQSEYPKWSRWWAEQGTTAPLYKGTECGDFILLP